MDDADYYQFNIAEYRILGTVSDKHSLDITVTLDHIPEGCDYDLVLYDGDGNQVGMGQDNGSGGKSVTVPNWNLENREYTVKVLAKDGSPVNEEEYYHLSFQTKQAAEDNVLRQQAKEMQEYAGALRRKLYDGQDATEEKQALQQIRERYEAYYTQQMDELHNKQAAEYLTEEEGFDQSHNRKVLYWQAKNALKGQGNNPQCRRSGELTLLDFLEATEGRNSNLAEKKFTLAGGGTLTCPSRQARVGRKYFYQGG